jgi:hypothetical protein
MTALGHIHEDDEVRQQALLATSKMLVTRWQFVSGRETAAATETTTTGAGVKSRA